MEPLKFVALDADDLAVVSTHLQDATVKVADVFVAAAGRRLVLAIDRFDWPAADGALPELRRCRSALRFERVNACKCRTSTRPARTRYSTCSRSNSRRPTRPAGIVTLTFSGGAALRLEVECLEAELADLGPSLGHRARPAHTDEPPTAVG